MTIASVILDVALNKPLDYAIPPEMPVSVGALVDVPVRGRKTRGIVIAIKETSEFPREKLQKIGHLCSNGPVLTQDLLSLAVWMARYYIAPLSKVIKTMLPAAVRAHTSVRHQHFISRNVSMAQLRDICAEKRRTAPSQAKVLDVMLQTKGKILLSQLAEAADVTPSAIRALVAKKVLLEEKIPVTSMLCNSYEFVRTEPKKLCDEQKNALQNIVEAITQNKFLVHLLYGITGSGKTEVYLQAIQRALDTGKGIIMLVPEISLTEQTIERFRSRFSEPIAVIHHRLSAGEKSYIWEKLRSGEMRICIGARSAIFAPIPTLGLIIVDEEHEQSYKQGEETPAYHARDVAIKRGQMTQSAVVLGSATPSFESFYYAQNQKYQLNALTHRHGATLPTVSIVDMREEFKKTKGCTYFSSQLLSKIQERHQKKEQVILFLNRRGYSTELICTACSASMMCPHCSAKLTFHKKEQRLICHLCSAESDPPTCCPACQAPSLIKYRGVGTEKIENTLHAILPGLKTVRVDADTTKHKGSLELLLKEFRSGKADVLIGTQMIAKGHHFPEVTLVGVLNADLSLNLPDFRAQEQVFQLITQVAGRAGRGSMPGEVVVQTLVPTHSTILHASKQDFLGFYNEELSTRQAFAFPPFTRIIKFTLSGANEELVLHCAEKLASALIQRLPPEFITQPPIASGHAKVKDTFFFHFFIRGPATAPIRAAFLTLAPIFPPAVHLHVDVDPSSTYF